MLILFYDTMWGHLPKEAPPQGVEISADRSRFSEADVVVFHLPECKQDRIIVKSEWDWRLVFDKRPGQRWVGWSMECEEYYPLMRNIRFMRHFDLTMTYRLTSDLPVTYVVPAAMAEAFRAPPRPKRATALAAAFVSSHLDRSGRQGYLQELARHMAFDSYGTFMRNRVLPNDRGIESKLAAIANYRFTLAFENACSEDYVTEKFYEPLQVGSVPVYLGAPNITSFAPGDHCFINAAEFPDAGRLAEYLMYLSTDEVAYASYFTWKQEPFHCGFTRLLALEAEPWIYRLCRALRMS